MNRRIAELDLLFKRIYEDSVVGKLSEERFGTMSSSYETEQRQLKADVERMESDVAKGEEVTADFQTFLINVRKYTDIVELTPTVLNEFISRIEVHAPEKIDGKRTQRIDIYYNAVGIINVTVKSSGHSVSILKCTTIIRIDLKKHMSKIKTNRSCCI